MARQDFPMVNFVFSTNGHFGLGGGGGEGGGVPTPPPTVYGHSSTSLPPSPPHPPCKGGRGQEGGPLIIIGWQRHSIALGGRRAAWVRQVRVHCPRKRCFCCCKELLTFGRPVHIQCGTRGEAPVDTREHGHRRAAPRVLHVPTRTVPFSPFFRRSKPWGAPRLRPRHSPPP